MQLMKIFKEKRFREMILLSCIALGLVIICYFVFINKDAGNDTTSTEAITMSQTENKLCSILSGIEGVGKINAYVNEETDGNIAGVVLVFEGADSLSVRMDVLNAAAQALGVDRKCISIYKMTK